MKLIEIVGVFFSVFGMIVGALVLLMFAPGLTLIAIIIVAAIAGWHYEGKRQERERNRGNH